ncbi:hypothetical protein NMG60_11007621 [Bertholletia excelsa]
MDLFFEPTRGVRPFEMEVGFFDTVSEIKDKIEKKQGIPSSKQTLVFDGEALPDNLNIHSSLILDRSRIQLVVTAEDPPSPAKKLRVMVMSKCGSRKIPVEVNVWDNVGELRKELERVHQRLRFPLPEDGYFFIHKQNVMEEDQTFQWHQVAQGDSIEIFNGSVTTSGR